MARVTMAMQEKRKKLKSELRRESIIQNALKIFDRRGFANTSLDDIARETGVKREAIYYYFNNRAEILLSIIRPQSESLVAEMRAIVESRGNFAHKLYLAVSNHLSSFDRNCLEMTVSMRDAYLEDVQPVRREMDRIWHDYEAMWITLIEEGQAKGDFARAGAPKMIAFGILGMCNWLARWYDPKGSVAISELVTTYYNMISGGLLTQAGRRKSAGVTQTARSADVAPKKAAAPAKPAAAAKRKKTAR